MDATVWIGLWAALFLGTHFALSWDAVRSRLINAVGLQGFLGIYSVVAFATLGPLIYEFAHYKHAGPMLWYLRANGPIRWFTWILMYLALVLFVASRRESPGCAPADRCRP